MSKKLDEGKRDNVYYLIRDVLSCFPDKFESNFLGIVNHHLIVKEATRQILTEETKQKKPRFRILMGALILQNSFLSQMPQIALHEVIDIVGALKYCFSNSSFKTVRKLSALVILRLFAALYFEYIFIPGRKTGGKSYLNQFKKYITPEDLVGVINICGFETRFIFERHGVDIGFSDERKIKVRKIFSEFY